MAWTQPTIAGYFYKYNSQNYFNYLLLNILLKSPGYGRFSRSVLGACACAFFTTGVENCVMSYVLPAARCELNLTTYHTGLINMAFMSGKYTISAMIQVLDRFAGGISKYIRSFEDS